MTTYGTSLYSAGHVGEPITSQQGYPSYLFLNKYDQAGRELWSKHFGSFGAGDTILGMSSVTDGVYLWVFLNGTSLLRKYDLSGNQTWTTQIANELGLYSASISATSDGIYWAGESSSGDVIGSYGLSGTIDWTVSLGNSSSGLKLSTYANSGTFYLAAGAPYPAPPPQVYHTRCGVKSFNHGTTHIYVGRDNVGSAKSR